MSAKPILLALLLVLPAASPAVDSAFPASQRPIFPAIGQGLLADLRSPLEFKAADLVWAAPGALALGLALWQDVPLYHGLHDTRLPWLDASMPWASMAGEGWVDAAFAGLGWVAGRGDFRKASATALEALAEGAILSTAMKAAFAADRPGVNENQRRFFDYGQGWGAVSSASFPSGHTMDAFTLAEVYGDAYGRWWTYPLAAIVGYSRVYNGAHWGSDVLAGAGLGILAGHLAVRAAREHGAPTLLFAVTRPFETQIAALRLVY